MFFDSHAHLDDDKFDIDRNILISNLNKNGVSAVINAGSDIDTSKKALQLAQKYDFIYSVAGVHPHETENMTENDFDELKKLLKNNKCLGIGEIGLDYFYDNTIKDRQLYWFERQLEYAAEQEMPVVIHDRDAHEDCINAVIKHGVHGVFHCYSGSAEMSRKLIEAGFYLSFGGVVTFKNSRKAVETIVDMPIDRLLIETDSPYLAPEPYRGHRNDPRLIYYTAKKISEIRNCSIEDIAKITFDNTCRLFGIKNCRIAE